MKFEELDDRMRALERFHSLRVPDRAYPIIRVDGRGFSKLTENRFEKPFDERFHEAMVRTTQVLFTDVRGFFAYTESDEISIACPLEWGFFDREVEKIVSVTASLASATFSLAVGVPVAFDSRIAVAESSEELVDYFRWRQADAARCALNGWCYWTLRKSGKKAREATRLLDGKEKEWKKELLSGHGIHFPKLPAWQRMGTGLYWEKVTKEGWNPVKKKSVTAERTRVRVDEALPSGDAYGAFLRSRVAGAP